MTRLINTTYYNGGEKIKLGTGPGDTLPFGKSKAPNPGVSYHSGPKTISGKQLASIIARENYGGEDEEDGDEVLQL